MTRQERQRAISSTLCQDPLLTDEDLADRFGVSVQTVRLDRLALGIPEVRLRTRAMAQRSMGQAGAWEPVGRLLDVLPGHRAVSLLEPGGAEQGSGAVAPGGDLVSGQRLFGQAESAVLALAGGGPISVRLVNVKFKRPVRAQERLIARAEVLRRRGDGGLVVLVETRAGEETVFRGKFLVAPKGDARADRR